MLPKINQTGEVTNQGTQHGKFIRSWRCALFSRSAKGVHGLASQSRYSYVSRRSGTQDNDRPIAAMMVKTCSITSSDVSTYLFRSYPGGDTAEGYATSLAGDTTRRAPSTNGTALWHDSVSSSTQRSSPHEKRQRFRSTRQRRR